MSAAETTTAAARFLADAGQRSKDVEGISFDGFNRYVTPDPVTGKERHWTRATTWAGAIKDGWGLSRWSRRMEAHGLAMRRDLLTTVAEDVSRFGAGAFDDRDCSRLDEAIAQAQEHAGSTVAATLGTVMHRFTEMVDDTGEFPEVVPPPLDRDLLAYRTTMQRHHFESVAIERLVCVPDLGVAGTLDRILSRGGAYIGDLKTGRDLGYGWGEIAVQLALYAHASYIWEGDHWEPMPPVDQQRAVVMHLPIGQARCDLYWVDIAAGWEAANQLCGPVRAWRNRRDLATKIDGALTSPPPEGEPERAAASAGPAPDVTARPPTSEGRSDHEPDEMAAAYTRSEWISARLQALATNERARTLVGLRWPPDTSPQPPWPDETIDALAAMLDDVEAEVGASFTTDPAYTPAQAAETPPEPRSPVPAWEVPDNGERAPDDVVAALTAFVGFLDDGQRATMWRWARSAARLSRPWAEQPMTRRMAAVATAAFGCAGHLHDDDRTRRALTLVLGDWDDAWDVGAVLGSLSIEQADRLAALADGYATGQRDGIDPV